MVLDGFTLSLTVDHRLGRISCALLCQDGAYLTKVGTHSLPTIS